MFLWSVLDMREAYLLQKMMIFRLQSVVGRGYALRSQLNPSKSFLFALSPLSSSCSTPTISLCRSCILLRNQNNQRHFSTSPLLRKDDEKPNTKSFENLIDSNPEEKEKPKQSPVPLPLRLAVVAVVLAVWAGIYYYATRKKDEKKLVERDQQRSKIDIGAEDYNLIDHTGKRVSKKDFLGKWLLLYFGFTHCPDICPEELEKMSEIIDIIDGDKSIPDLLPIFLSVDPERDTPELVKNYVKEFHPKFVGLTGSMDDVKQATKAFRVYYSNGPKDDDNDYIVDHSIVMYLMSPKGSFVDYYGSRSVSKEDISSGIKKNMKTYQRLHG